MLKNDFNWMLPDWMPSDWMPFDWMPSDWCAVPSFLNEGNSPGKLINDIEMHLMCGARRPVEDLSANGLSVEDRRANTGKSLSCSPQKSLAFGVQTLNSDERRSMGIKIPTGPLLDHRHSSWRIWASIKVTCQTLSRLAKDVAGRTKEPLYINLPPPISLNSLF